MPNKYDPILENLITAPDSQLDKNIRDRIEILIARGYNAEDIKSILDVCAYCALASSFVMIILDAIWQELKKEGLNVK